MFPLTIEQTVARATGESVGRIRRLGFSTHRQDHSNTADDIQLVLDCPFCRRPTFYPGFDDQGEILLAECQICDVEFEFDLREVYVLAASPSATSSFRRQAC